MDKEAAVRRELRAGWLAMSLVLGSTSATTSARGEERAKPGPSAESERDRAVRDFQEGRRAHVEGRLEEAELSYLRAWRRMKSYDIATNLGQVQLKLNKPVSAAKHLAFGLRTVGPEVEPERLEVMQALLTEAKAQVGTLRVRVKNVPDVEMYLNGERVPEEAAKHEMYLEPGEHVLVLRRAGYEDAVIRVAAVPGVTETLTRELKPKAEKAPEGAGAAAPAAVGAPAKLSEAPIEAPVRSAEAHASRPRKAMLIGGAATAGAAAVAVAGVLFTVLANGRAADADAMAAELARNGGRSACWSRTTPRCSRLHDLNAQSDTFHNLAVAGFVGAGIASAATLVYALWPRTSTDARVTPAIGVNTGGVVVTGRF